MSQGVLAPGGLPNNEPPHFVRFYKDDEWAWGGQFDPYHVIVQ